MTLHERNANPRLRILVAGSVLSLGMLHATEGPARDSKFVGRGDPAGASILIPAPSPLGADDADRDGLADSLEAELASRYAPVVVLHPEERNRPASIQWLLARVPLGDPRPRANVLVALTTPGVADERQGGEREADFSDEVRAGSGDPRDWVTYVHVYPRTDGGINVQYWFFYPYNDGPLFFDHDSDWEHVTVGVDGTGQPFGVYFAQHRNSNPGVYRAWTDVRKFGDHPIVLSAAGTHASYPDDRSLGWFEHTSHCVVLEGCPDPIWRTWEAGGLTNVGERGAVLAAREALTYKGRWGTGGGRFNLSESAPRGPMHQRSFYSAGFNLP